MAKAVDTHFDQVVDGRIVVAVVADFLHEIGVDAMDTHGHELIATARPYYAGDPLSVELEETAYALDCKTIDFCLPLFPWARYRQLNAAVKMHRTWKIMDWPT